MYIKRISDNSIARGSWKTTVLKVFFFFWRPDDDSVGTEAWSYAKVMFFLKYNCVRLMGFVVILHEHSTQWDDWEQVYQQRYWTLQKNSEYTQSLVWSSFYEEV